jgi:hypothetical protein
MSSLAVLFVPGRAGADALRAACELAEAQDVTITLVAEVPRAQATCRCGCSPRAYNEAVAAQVANELGRARSQLEELGRSVEAVLLVEGADPSFREFVASRRFDHALRPSMWPWRLKDLARRRASARNLTAC